MPPTRIEASRFSPDTRAFLEQLAVHGVRYLIVGGEAAILYGHARLTGDSDFFYALDHDNIERLFQSLHRFWDGPVPGVRSAADLAEPGAIFMFGRPPNRIDLINQIDGVEFEQAWLGRLEITLVGPETSIVVNYIGIDDLIRNKEQVGRPKDLDDLIYLRRKRESDSG